MRCYLDSSVIVRIVFGEPHPLPEWKRITHGFSSRLLRVECRRTVHRTQQIGVLTAETATVAHTRLDRLLRHLAILPLTERLFARAEQPFGAALGTLDAIHLATALLWQERHGGDFHFATHDRQLALAARLHGLSVIGDG